MRKVDIIIALLVLILLTLLFKEGDRKSVV